MAEALDLIENSLDLPHMARNAEVVDGLKDRVFEERIKILNARLAKAVEQRDRFAKNYHEVSRVPYQERREILKDCDLELEQAGQSAVP